MSLAEFFEWNRPDDTRTWVWCDNSHAGSISHPQMDDCTNPRIAWQPGDPT